MNKRVQIQTLHGTVLIPASKSDGQRAILAAALSKGTSELYNCGHSDDERSMITNVINLGAKVIPEGHKLTITGIQHFPKHAKLNVGESGLGLRLVTSICAAFDGEHYITGEGTLLRRPQGFFEHHFTQLGVRVNSNEGFLPITLQGKLHGGELEVDGSLSSQFLSGLLMAMPLLDLDSQLTVFNLKSIPYAQMTIDTLHEFGIEIQNHGFEKFDIKGNQHYKATKYAVESDWSSAGYWLIASALGHKVKVVGVSEKSHQADRAIIDALVAANCVVTIDETGITVDGAERKPFEFNATHCPDLFPTLAVLAARCSGESKIQGLRRLKNKESDRGMAIQSEFAKMGIKVDLHDDEMIIQGGTNINFAVVDSHHDHRIAMCLAILALAVDGGIEITNAEVVSKSYPEFWEHLDSLTIR